MHQNITFPWDKWGTIVEILATNMYEVEFCNKKGETIAMLPVSGNHLLLLHYDSEKSHDQL